MGNYDTSECHPAKSDSAKRTSQASSTTERTSPDVRNELGVRLYDSDVLWTVPIKTPNGDHLDFETWATDSEEAQILAAESLLPEWGSTCEDVAAYVGTPERIRRSA